jgi:hypothetical protein
MKSYLKILMHFKLKNFSIIKENTMNLKISGTIFIILLSGYLASGICKSNQTLQKQPENDNLFDTGL